MTDLQHYAAQIEALAARAGQLRRGLSELGYEIGGHPSTPIVPVRIGEEWSAVQAWKVLLDHGVYTNCAVTPAVPTGKAVLRTSVMAIHMEEQIDRSLSGFEAARSVLR